MNNGITRVELAALTGLTAPAITNITKRLLEDGLIREGSRRRIGRGQPAIALEICNEARHAIGLNIDRDHVTIVVVDFSGKTLARLSRAIDFALPQDVRALYRAQINTLLRDAGVEMNTLVGIGVAMPDQLGDVALPGRPEGYGAWRECDLPALLDGPLDVPVFVENDATAAAIGEMQLGLGQRYPSFFYILVSSGLGGGLVVDGRYYRGANGRSGELGFIEIADETGERVSLQDIVSLSGLARVLAQNGLSLTEVLERKAPSAAASGAIERWLGVAADKLAGVLETITCLFDPHRIVIGGRLPPHIIDALADRSQRVTANRLRTFPKVCPVERAALSEDAPAIGAAILPLSHFLLPQAAIE